MPIPLLATKLFIPPPRPDAVLRAGLIARLNAGLHRKLTLISAPAGFGKTSLASAWVTGCGRSAAWLSLDTTDTDPATFLAYVVAALQTILPTVGAEVASLLESAQPPALEVLLPLLINQIAALPQPAILVLDDYHTLQSQPIDQALSLLVDHLPPQLHLVIATREDPNLPLARYRARSQLNELRAVDLRFTAAEAAAFLREVMGLSLGAADIAVLEERTEGWVAGLQLAALSIQGHQDVAGFIQAFAGDHRYILDYLVEEVLQRQPAAVRSFLLQTALLDRLHGPLCDAVTGQAHSSARLELLYRSNYFVVPLDDQRQWYRYHHLFADVLKAQLVSEQPEQLATLHQRASAWYAAHGLLADAIRHALAAQDVVRAADLVELAVPAMRRSRQEATLLSWLKALPDELIATRPVLSVQYAGTLLSAGELAGVEPWLRRAERWLAAVSAPGELPQAAAGAMIVHDAAEFRQLSGSIAVYRAAHALALDDIPHTLTYAHQALEHLREGDHVMRGAASALLGLAYVHSGELAVAYEMYAAGMAQLQLGGHIADAIGGAITLADIHITQGRLRAARQIYAQGLQLANAHGTPRMRGTADMYVGLSDLLREQNDLPGAMQYLRRSQEQGEHTGFPQHPYRWRIVLARIRAAEGDLEGALALFDEAQQRYVSDFSPNLRPVAAWKARLWLAQGRLDDALGWAEGVAANDQLSYRQEFAHITQARVLLAHARHAPAGDALRVAIRLLDRLLEAAEAGGRAGSMLEILVLQALAYQVQGAIPAALRSLGRALRLAEPEGYVRLFVDEGLPMKLLIAECRLQLARSGDNQNNRQAGIGLAYIDRLLAAFLGGETQASTQPAPHVQPALIEPLSEREREVLRLLQTDLDGPQIARALVVSLNTLRTHTKHIYAKLGVSSRRAAVRRAEELDLL